MKKLLLLLLLFPLILFCGCKKKTAAVTEAASDASQNEADGTGSSDSQYTGIDSGNLQINNGDDLMAEERGDNPDIKEAVSEEDILQQNQLEELENQLSMQSPILETSTNSDNPDGIEVEAVEKRILDANNRLKFMEYDDEIYIPHLDGKSKYEIHTDGKNYYRFFYNDSYKLTKKETWEITTVENSRILSTDEYVYTTGEYPVQKITTTDASVIKTWYNAKNLVKKYIVYEKDEDKERMVQVNLYAYNKKGKIIKEQETNYNYIDGIYDSQTVKRQLFLYKTNSEGEIDESVPPDYEYYEDGVLKIRTRYTSKTDYTNQIFFDNIYSVTTYYENYKKVKDVYAEKGIAKRVKNYE